MKLGLSSVSPPEAENFIFRAISHVNQALVPPPFNDYAVHGSEYETVVSNFEETQIPLGVDTRVNGEWLPMHLSRGEGFQIYVIAVLKNNGCYKI